MHKHGPAGHISMPPEITRESVRSVSWWNQANQPLQDNQTVRIEICSGQTFQTWEGLGGAVSELGMQALGRLPETARAVRVRCFSQLLNAVCFRNPDGRFCLLMA